MVKKLGVAICCAMVLCGCSSGPKTDLTEAALIPKPQSVEATGAAFLLDKNTIVYVETGYTDLVSVAQRLVSQVNLVTGFTSEVQTVDEAPESGIYFEMPDNIRWTNEDAYFITITEELITISAPGAAGAFNAVQTLIQLIPFQKADEYIIPTGVIGDSPLFSWRGAMLDVARHFFSVEDVKRYIDLISYYKINKLHLHLTDDQGWRIEIKSWPNLALHGGSTEVGGGNGGYYTQDEYKDIVAYAQSRFVTIIPEIDLPGHINSALASYGELNGGTIVPEEGRVIISNPVLGGKAKPTELYTGIEVGWSTLRLEKPETFRFVEDVIRELSEMTPGPYIHIGGDEAHVTKKEDYIEFINRFRDIVKANGKIMIGWEEIGQASIDGESIAQYWNNDEYVTMASSKGAKIIMSPAKKIYLDMKYDSTTKLGLNWANYVEVDTAYLWDPLRYAYELEPERIIGVEAPLWSETIETMNDIEFLAFPRIIAVAEVAWTPFENRSWDSFSRKLSKHGSRMKALGIDYYQSPRVNWSAPK
ncbi:MAG: family 20 glycosylhydrolase [Cyclobacteriaceae bacterium]